MFQAARQSQRVAAGAGRPLGMTLIEILTALTLSLVIMAAVVVIIGTVTSRIVDSRAMMDMTSREAAALSQLQADLQGHTVTTLVWQRPEAASGYLEYVEGVGNDRNPQPIPEDAIMRELASEEHRVLGDVDDVLMLTVQSRGLPFVGRGPNGEAIESQVAEVIWFVRPMPSETEVAPLTLYRRVLLIRPDLQSQIGGAAGRDEFYDRYDISARYEGGRWIANTLDDLTRPESRFAHTTGDSGGSGADDAAGGSFGSSEGGIGKVNLSLIKPFAFSSDRFGEDAMLVNCIGFDIKVFDPMVTIKSQDESALSPGDFKYEGEPIGRGAFVDLGQGNMVGVSEGEFSRPPHPKSKLSEVAGASGIYDTWSYHYEWVTIDGRPRPAADGRDTKGADGEDGVVDDAGERQSSPPYPVPLRGLQVQVRVYDPSTRQVRQATVDGEFMPL